MDVNSDLGSVEAGTAAASFADIAREARAAASRLEASDAETRAAALRGAATALRDTIATILAANREDVAATEGDPAISGAFRDRLALTEARIEAMASGVETVAALPDPLERVLAEWRRPNGLLIRRVPQPIGVIGMIYESRPNVGADAASICVKSGNAVILRGGSESRRSAVAIRDAMQAGLAAAGLPATCVQIAPTQDRDFVASMLAASGAIDLIIPRGGRSLVERVARDARVPVLAHAEGLNHTYIHASADDEKARRIVANAKMRRPGICGATETLLIDDALAGFIWRDAGWPWSALMRAGRDALVLGPRGRRAALVLRPRGRRDALVLVPRGRRHAHALVPCCVAHAVELRPHCRR